MEKPKPSTIAWCALAAGVTAYDLLCPPGETLSEGVDRALEHPHKKIVTLGAIAVTAAHLANVLPQRVDPYHQLTKWKMVGIIKEALDGES